MKTIGGVLLFAVLVGLARGQTLMCDPDNLFCAADITITGMTDCLTRNQLCDGNNDCQSGNVDEGDSAGLDQLGSLNCSTDMFDCGDGSTSVSLDAMCNGMNDCGNFADEIHFLCRDRCLPPAFGGCAVENRECVNNEQDRQCGNCLDGFVLIGGECTPIIFIEFEETSYTATEGTDPSVEVCINVTNPGDLEPTDSFDISLVAETGSGDTAQGNGQDYEGVTVDATISQTATRHCITVDIIDDSIVEVIERFSVRVTEQTVEVQALNNVNTVPVFILEDDTAEFELRIDSVDVPEDVGSVPFTVLFVNNVTLSAGLQIDVLVELDVAGSTAVEFEDFSAPVLPETFTFIGPLTGSPTGVRGNPQGRAIGIIDDSLIEPMEDIELTASLSSPTPGFDVTRATLVVDSGTINIEDNDDLTVSIESDTYSVDESDGSLEVCVVVDAGEIAPNGPTLSVTLESSDGTAVDPDDFIDISEEFMFGPGTSTTVGNSMCVNITIEDDQIAEGDEQFNLALSTTTPSLVIFGTGSATVDIIDDAVVLMLVAPLPAVPEDAGSVSIEVQLVAPSTLARAVSVMFSSAAGSALGGGTDYTDIPGGTTMMFLDGAVSGETVSVDVDINNDDLVESTESFMITVSSSDLSVTFMGLTSAEVSIIDEDVAIFQFSEPVYSTTEGDGSTTVAVELAPTSDTLTFDIEVSVNVAGGTAMGMGVDYMFQASPPLMFTFGNNDGPGTSQIFDIDIINDQEVEDTEDILLMGSVVTVFPRAEFTPDEATVEIADNDVRFAVVETEITVTEGTVPSVTISVRLTQGGPTNRDIILNFMTSDISATNSSDYTGIDVDVIVPMGSFDNSMYTTDITIIDDEVVESPEESFLVSVSTTDSDAQFEAGLDEVTVNIEDDDELSVMFENPNYSVNEGTGFIMKCIEADGTLDRNLLVNVSTVVSGEAEDGTDFISQSGTIVFTPTSVNQLYCWNITIVNDNITENDETFTCELSSSDPAADLGPPSTVTIIDDDSVTIQPEDPSYSVTEGPDTYLIVPIVVIGMKDPDVECTVQVFTVDGTAMANSDYFPVNVSLTFNINVTRQNISIHIINDMIVEAAEEGFFVRVWTSSDPRCIPGRQAFVWLFEDDVMVGDDPHFSIALPTGNMLCYTVQGEHGFTFNLISNKIFYMNAMFVPDSRREEVTWLGSMGVIVKNNGYKGSNSTALRFESKKNKIYISDKVVLGARNIEKLTFHDGKLTISEAPPVEGFKYPAVFVDLQDVGLSFTIKFMNEHLDMIWHSTGHRLESSHGIIGQFFRKGVEIDEVRKILIMPNKEPVPVMRRPVWSFMEREVADDQLCWTAMNPGYQGDGLIDGTYLDYLVNDVLDEEWNFQRED